MTEEQLVEYDPEKRPAKPYRLPSRTLLTPEEAEQVAEEILEVKE